jgi:hypothetical protein
VCEKINSGVGEVADVGHCSLAIDVCLILFYVTDGNIMYLTDASRFLISCVIQHYAPVVGWGGGRNRCIMLIMTMDPGDKH